VRLSEIAIGRGEEQWLEGSDLVAAIPISRWQQAVAALVVHLPRAPRLGNVRTGVSIVRATATETQARTSINE